MNQIILGLLLAGLFFECRPTKSVNTITEKIRIDTIRDYKVIFKYNAVHDTLIIDNPCDSAGILTTFYSKIILPQGKVIIRSYRGKIQATINIDSIANIYENKYRNKETNLSQNYTKIITKFRIPIWIMLTLIFETIIIFSYIYFKVFFKLK